MKSHWSGTFSFCQRKCPLSLAAGKLRVQKARGSSSSMVVGYLKVGVGGFVCRWCECIAPTRSQVSLEQARPAGGLSQQRRTQEQQQRQPQRRGRLQGCLTWIGFHASPQLRLAARLLTQHARVCWGTAAAHVVHTDATILAAQQFVITHPGCGAKTRGKREHQTCRECCAHCSVTLYDRIFINTLDDTRFTVNHFVLELIHLCERFLLLYLSLCNIHHTCRVGACCLKHKVKCEHISSATGKMSRWTNWPTEASNNSLRTYHIYDTFLSRSKSSIHIFRAWMSLRFPDHNWCKRTMIMYIYILNTPY